MTAGKIVLKGEDVSRSGIGRTNERGLLAGSRGPSARRPCVDVMSVGPTYRSASIGTFVKGVLFRPPSENTP